MKVITIKEPWASLILSGEKTIETRTWKTNYRGKILLHASASPKSKISGCIFAIANLVECREMREADEIKARCDLYPNANSWILQDVKPTELKQVKGKLGLWEFDCEIRERGKPGELTALFG